MVLAVLNTLGDGNGFIESKEVGKTLQEQVFVRARRVLDNGIHEKDHLVRPYHRPLFVYIMAHGWPVKIMPGKGTPHSVGGAVQYCTLHLRRRTGGKCHLGSLRGHPS